MSHPVTAIIADDDEIIRYGFESVFQNHPAIKVLTIAANGKELLELTASHQPDIVLFEIDMADRDGMQIVEHMKEHHPAVGTIAYTFHTEPYIIRAMLDANVNGYIVKKCSREKLVRGITDVFEKGNYYAPCCRHLLEGRSQGSVLMKLTDMEIQVLQLLCRQWETADIAKALNKSEKIISLYRSNLLRKTGATNGYGLTMYAIADGHVDAMEWFQIKGTKRGEGR